LRSSGAGRWSHFEVWNRKGECRRGALLRFAVNLHVMEHLWDSGSGWDTGWIKEVLEGRRVTVVSSVSPRGRIEWSLRRKVTFSLIHSFENRNDLPWSWQEGRRRDGTAPHGTATMYELTAPWIRETDTFTLRILILILPPEEAIHLIVVRPGQGFPPSPSAGLKGNWNFVSVYVGDTSTQQLVALLYNTLVLYLWSSVQSKFSFS
jgi:hypothetical protein